MSWLNAASSTGSEVLSFLLCIDWRDTWLGDDLCCSAARYSCVSGTYLKSLLSISSSRCSNASEASTCAVVHVACSLDGIFFMGISVLNCVDELRWTPLSYESLGCWNKFEDDSEDFSLSRRDSFLAAGFSGLSSLCICSITWFSVSICRLC